MNFRQNMDECQRRVKIIDEYGENLTDGAIEFIASLIDDPGQFISGLTSKQISWINRLYDNKVADEHK